MLGPSTDRAQSHAHSAHTTEAGILSPYALLDQSVHLSGELNAIIQTFWSLSPGVRLLSVAPEPHYYWHTQDFYVAQKGLDKEGLRWAQLRLSENLCQMLFEHALGKSGQHHGFSLGTIRHFEVFLMEQFSRKLFGLLHPALFHAQPPKRKAKPNEYGFDADPLMHLVWTVGCEPEQVNQIVLTGPQLCFKSEFPQLPERPRLWLPDASFLEAHSWVTLQVGRSWARLEELQQLDVDDVVVFEDSHVSQWQFVHADPSHPHMTTFTAIPVQLPMGIVTLPALWPQQGNEPMSPMNQTVWDNLQVEVTASFDPIRLPLKRLKEMEQGLVLEMADLMDNRLKVLVEGHPVAWGELLVVGDKFGVRIQALEETLQPASQALLGQPVTQALPSAGADPNAMASQEDMAQQMAQMAEGFDAEGLATMGGGGDLMNDLVLDETDFDDLDDEEDWT